MPSGKTAITIEYENDDLLVVSKPAGLPVYSTKKREQEDSVVSWLVANYPTIKTVGDAGRPGIVHRLDKQTSGLLVVAKNNQAFEYLKKLFSSRNITKEYLALVFGELPKHGIIDKALAKIGFRGSSRVRVDTAGKKAVTEYWYLEYYKYNAPQPPLKVRGGGGELSQVDIFTLVRVKLHTGRTHQIRVHFSSTKHPVMGDDLYGKPNSLKLKDLLPRQFLHASRLEFKLMDGTWLEVESELPRDLKLVLKQLVPEPVEGPSTSLRQ